MRNLVTCTIIIFLLACALLVVGRPQDSTASEQTPTKIDVPEVPDLESGDSQNRFFVVKPPRQERPGNFVRFGTPRRPNMPWQTSPRHLFEEQTISSILPSSPFFSDSPSLILSSEGIDNPEYTSPVPSSELSNSLSSEYPSSQHSNDTVSIMSLPNHPSLINIPSHIPNTQVFETNSSTELQISKELTSFSSKEIFLSATSAESLNTEATITLDLQPETRQIFASQEKDYENSSDTNYYVTMSTLPSDNSSETFISIDNESLPLTEYREAYYQDSFESNETLDTFPPEQSIPWEYVLDRELDFMAPIPENESDMTVSRNSEAEVNSSRNFDADTDYHDRLWVDLSENDEYDHRDLYTDEYSHNIPLRINTDDLESNRDENTDAQDSTVDLNIDRHQQPGLNHNLRLHSFQNTYPFESEVRGEGYHSRIRFDPFGGAIPQTGQHYPVTPVTQTFGNWHSGPALDTPPYHQLSPTAYRNGETFENEEISIPLYSEDPNPSSHSPETSQEIPEIGTVPPFEYHPSESFSPSTYRPSLGRPFAYPGNLAALLEGGNIRDASSVPVKGFLPDQINSTSHDQTKHDFDYPVVANVFPDNAEATGISEGLISNSEERKDLITGEGNISNEASVFSQDRDNFEATDPVFEQIHSQDGINTDLKVPFLTTSNAENQAYEEVGSQEERNPPTSSLDYNTDYYDLYDEFMDMYYNAGDYSPTSESDPRQYNSASTETSTTFNIANLPAVPSGFSTAARTETSISTSFSLEDPAPTTDISISHPTTIQSTSTTDLLWSTSGNTDSTTAPTTTSTSTQSTTTTTSSTTATTTTTSSTTPISTPTSETTTTSTQTSVPSSPTTSAIYTNANDQITTVPSRTTETHDQHFPSSIIAKAPNNVDNLQGTGSSIQVETTNETTNKTAADSKIQPVISSNNGPEGSLKGGSLISLSEILQGIGMSLPQFLVALKGHEMTLKEFTTSLQQKSLTQQQFKQSKGDLELLLEMLKDDPVSSSTAIEEPTEEREVTTKASLIPYWLTSRPTWRPSTTTESITSTTESSTISTTTEPSTTTLKPLTSVPPPKIFGFMPTFSEKINIAPNNNTAAQTESPVTGKAPIPIKLDIASIMKDKGLSATDILHDLGSLFTIGNDERNPADIEKSETNESKPEGNAVAEDSTEMQEDNTSTLKPYTVPETPVSLKPYRPSGGSERYRPRPYRPNTDGHYSGLGNRGILTNRFQTTERTTLIPPYQPPPIKQSDEISSLLHVLHNSTANTAGGSISFGLPIDEDAVPGIPFSDSTHPRSSSSDGYHPIYDDDPDSLNVSTKSAILAASILGGVAMCVFLAILVVVMYRGRVRRRKPLTLQSDSSSSSTPPIYSTRMSGGKGLYKTSGFWGTLKKRFDPYSLSPTPTVMT